MSYERLAPALEPARWRAVTAASLVAVEAALGWRFGWAAPLAAFLYLGAVLTVVAVIDARTSRVPNVVVLPSYPIGIGLLAIAAGIGGQWWPLERALVAMAAVAGLYLVLALAAGGQRMGLGDVTVGGLLGLLLGWAGWSALSSGVVLGWAAALVVVLVARRGPTGRPAAIPAVPCLWLGALVALVATR